MQLLCKCIGWYLPKLYLCKRLTKPFVARPLEGCVAEVPFLGHRNVGAGDIVQLPETSGSSQIPVGVGSIVGNRRLI